MSKQVFLNEKHMAASAIIVTKQKPQKTLLVFHKKYNLWIQPGGHVESHENPLEAAIRETREETGIDISFLSNKTTKLNYTSVLPVPDFFMEEFVPEYNGIPQHYHVDILYVVEVIHQDVKMRKEELHDIGWFTLGEALKLPMWDNLKMMLKKVMGN